MALLKGNKLMIRIALGTATIVVLAGILGGCAAADVVGTAVGAATTVAGTAVHVGATVVNTAADTVSGSDDSKDKKSGD